MKRRQNKRQVPAILNRSVTLKRRRATPIARRADDTADLLASPVEDTKLDQLLAAPKRQALILILAFFVGLGSFAAIVPLSSAAIAPGVINPEGRRRQIQHLEGGIIRAIHVSEGDIVREGEPLITLDETQPEAAFKILTEQYYSLSAIQARLLAEQGRAERIDFPIWLLADMAPDALEELVRTQTDLFESRTSVLSKREDLQLKKIAQLNEEIGGLEAQRKSASAQIRLIDQELGGLKDLFGKGLVANTRILALERTRAELEGSRAEFQAAIARAEQQISEAEIQIVTSVEQAMERINQELSSTRTLLGDVQAKVGASRDVLERTVIRAPVSGTVANLRYTSVSAVVRPGEPIVDVVPDKAELLIDAYVKPIDIDNVHQGLSAKISLPAFKQRNLPEIRGEVIYVAADRTLDEATGQPFYLARVRVDTDVLEASDGTIVLTSGMPAEVFIKTGERTALQYLTGPFLASFDRSFTEQ